MFYLYNPKKIKLRENAFLKVITDTNYGVRTIYIKYIFTPILPIVVIHR